ncbi:MAG TPA: PVC-type heme-binding CxxCH protein [Verrucomicrobiae bacterium]|nr:PVC-type heme-binding CxxCH protein [Verrucomicrobiae bacterium]
MKHSFLLFWIGGAVLASDHSFGASFKVGSQTLTVPAGFEVELVAKTPLADRPIAAAFDEQGRLYVSDSAGSNDKVDKQQREKPHRIVRLEDTDGDGRFDKSTVFADQMMFPEGVMWYDGSVYVGAPPSIWKLTDTNNDGVADQREEWHAGKTVTGCANDMHGPYLGPDGWIYWCKGAFAEQTYELDHGKVFKSRAAHIFRKRPDGSGLETVMTGGMDNPVDVAFTPGGERLFTTTFVHQPEAGKRDGLVHAVYGGVYGKVNGATDGHKRTGDLMPVMQLWGPAAPCGLTRLESDQFGAGYQNNFLACLFNLRKVTRHELTPDGATFRSTTTDFVTSDSPDFHPTDVIEDADGSVLVIDTGGWYKLCCPTSQLAKPDILGAIYRIRRQGAPKVEDPRGLKLAWNSLHPRRLVALLEDPRPAVRERARQQLGRIGAEAVPELARALKKSVSSDDLRLSAVWALTRITDASARAANRVALTDSDLTVRQAALHAVAAWRDAQALPKLESLLRDPIPATRRVTAEALGRLGAGASPAVPGLLAAAGAVHSDRFLEHSLIYALIEIGDAKATRAGLSSHQVGTQRAALIALDQMDGGGLKPEEVTPLLTSSDPVLRQTAWWLAGRRGEWGDVLADFFRVRLTGSNAPAGDQAELARQLAQLSRSAPIQKLLSDTLRSQHVSTPARLTALRAMAQAGLKETPEDWFQELIVVLESRPTALLGPAVSTARALTLPKGGHTALAAALEKVGRDAAVAPETRLEALAALPGGLGSVDGELFTFLRAHLEPTEPVNARGAAATVLSRARLQADQLLNLADSLKTLGPLEVPRLLAAFEKPGDEALGLRVVSALKDSKRAGLRADMVQPLLTNYPARVQQEGESLLALLNVDTAAQTARLEKLLSDCHGGDVRRGQAIFNSAKAACAACHAIGYLGGRVGPDLTSIGQVRSERDLLESIVFPSASFVRSYEPVLVSTKDGEEYSGVVRKDAADELVLATGPETEVRITRSDIAEVRPGQVSVMPQGLDEQLSRQELADLLAFLKNTKWGAQ